MAAATDHATEELKRIMRERHGRRRGASADSSTNGSPLNGLSTTSTPTSTSTSASTSTSTSRPTSPPITSTIPSTSTSTSTSTSPPITSTIPSTPIAAPIAHPIGQHKTQEEMDREMALQLFQQEQAAIESRRRQREEASKDAELARHLQEEEEKKERERKEIQQQQQRMSEQEAQRLIQEEAQHEHEHEQHESEEEDEIAPRHERGEHGEQLIGGEEEEEERESDEALAARLQQEEDEEEQRLAEARARRPNVISFQFGGPNGARRISASFGGNNHIDGLNGMLMSLLGMYQHQPFIGHHPLFHGLRMSSSDSGSDMSYDDLLALQERIGNVRPVNRPAKKEEIEQLPVRTFKAEEKSNSDSKNDTTGDSQKTCCICMSEFEDGDMIRSLPCFHVFHKDEIDQWLLSNEKCPICKLPVSTTDVTATPSTNSTSATSRSATSSQPHSAR